MSEGQQTSHRRVTIVSTISTQQALAIETTVNQVISFLQQKQILKDLFDDIVLDSDINMKYVKKILKKPEYMDNALFQVYVSKKGFFEALRVRIGAERKRRAKKPASKSSSIAVVRQNNEDHQLIIEPLLVGDVDIQIQEKQFENLGLLKRLKLVEQNMEELQDEFKQLREENIKLKQQLREGSSGNQQLSSKQQQKTSHRKRDDKENEKQDYKNNKKITTTIKKVDPITNIDGPPPNSNIQQVLGEIHCPHENRQQEHVQCAQQEVNSQMLPTNTGASLIGNPATVSTPQNQHIATAIQSLVISTSYQQNQEEQTISIQDEDSSHECSRENTGDSLLIQPRPEDNKPPEEVKQYKEDVAPNQKTITALGCKIKHASLACLGKGKPINDDVINVTLNIMLKSLATEELRKKVILEDTCLYSDMISLAYSDDDIKRIIEEKLLKNKKDCCYYIVPIHLADEQHWCLAIYGNVNNSMKISDTQIELDRGMFCLYLDSYFDATDEVYDNLKRIGRLIKEVLGVETGYGTYLPFYSSRLNIPKQNNDYDCGIFLLEYAARFLLDPASLILEPSVMIYPGQKYQRYEECIIWNKFKNLSKEEKRLFDEINNRDQRKISWFDGNITKERRNNIIHFFKELFICKSLTDKLAIEIFKESYTF